MNFGKSSVGFGRRGVHILDKKNDCGRELTTIGHLDKGWVLG